MLLSLTAVSVRYARSTAARAAVDRVTLSLAPGQIGVLIGPSGCGKTTSLRMIAGLEDITAGTLKIGDVVVNDKAPKDRDIAMVFQSYALYPHMTVKENLAFGLKLRKVSKDEIDRRVNEAAAILDLAKLLARKPKELSGGQRQRVALGRAIVREPAVFLMDEPLSNLDAKLRVQTRAQILRLHARLKTTVVYVTHDQVEAMTMGTRIAVMNEGLLQQVGTPHDLYDLPVNRFVAGFIGSPAMNLLEARVSGKRVSAGGIEIEVSDDRAKALANRASVTIGFRPEHLRIGKAGKDEAQFELEADVVEYLGAQELLHFSTSAGDVLALVDSENATKRGSKVKLALPLEKLHLFDAETGTAIR